MKKSLLIPILIIMFFTSGCVNKNAKGSQENIMQANILNDYITSVEKESNNIKSYLENDALTQADMNIKSQELYELWDDALNYLRGELKNNLSEEEFTKLQDEQRIWISEKETAVKEAGKEFEGGSIYSLVVNSEGAKITQERVYKLYELLKQVN